MLGCCRVLASSATGRRQIECATEGRRSTRFALGCILPTSCPRVWVLGGGRAAYALRGFGLYVVYIIFFASSPRALMAVLPPAANAVGGYEWEALVLGE